MRTHRCQLPPQPPSICGSFLLPAPVVLWGHFPPAIRFSKRSEWKMERSSRCKTSLSFSLPWDSISPLLPTQDSLPEFISLAGYMSCGTSLCSMSQFTFLLLPLMSMEMVIEQWRRRRDLERGRSHEVLEGSVTLWTQSWRWLGFNQSFPFFFLPLCPVCYEREFHTSNLELFFFFT